jgi:hypothetical protein
VALALLGAALFAVTAFCVLPVVNSITGLAAEVEEKREVLGRLQDTRQAEADAQGLKAEADALDVDRLVLAGASDALKAASLQTVLADIATAQGLRFQSTRSLPPRERNTVRLIGVEASFEASLAELQGLLNAVDIHKPVLIVSGLHVAAAPGAVVNPETAGDRLTVRLEILAPASAGKG